MINDVADENYYVGRLNFHVISSPSSLIRRVYTVSLQVILKKHECDYSVAVPVILYLKD